jgi:hypothetical protein
VTGTARSTWCCCRVKGKKKEREEYIGKKGDHVKFFKYTRTGRKKKQKKKLIKIKKKELRPH